MGNTTSFVRYKRTLTLKREKMETGWPRLLCVHPDGELIATAGRGFSLGRFRPCVWLWRSGSGDVYCTIPLRKLCGALAFHPSGGMLAIGAGTSVVVHHIATGKRLCKLKGAVDDVTSVSFNPASPSQLVAASYSTVRVWDIASHAALATFKCSATYAAFSATGTQLLTASRDKFRLWSLRRAPGSTPGTADDLDAEADLTPRHLREVPADDLRALAVWHPKVQGLLAYSADKTVRVLDTSCDRVSHSILLDQFPSCVEWHPSAQSRVLAIAQQDSHYVEFWSASPHEEPTRLGRVSCHHNFTLGIAQLAFCGDGNTVAVGLQGDDATRRQVKGKVDVLQLRACDYKSKSGDDDDDDEEDDADADDEDDVPAHHRGRAAGSRRITTRDIDGEERVATSASPPRARGIASSRPGSGTESEDAPPCAPALVPHGGGSSLAASPSTGTSRTERGRFSLDSSDSDSDSGGDGDNDREDAVARARSTSAPVRRSLKSRALASAGRFVSAAISAAAGVATLGSKRRSAPAMTRKKVSFATPRPRRAMSAGALRKAGGSAAAPRPRTARAQPPRRSRPSSPRVHHRLPTSKVSNNAVQRWKGANGKPPAPVATPRSRLKAHSLRRQPSRSPKHKTGEGAEDQAPRRTRATGRLVRRAPSRHLTVSTLSAPPVPPATGHGLHRSASLPGLPPAPPKAAGRLRRAASNGGGRGIRPPLRRRQTRP